MQLHSHRLFVGLLVLRFGLLPLLHGGLFARVHDNLDSALVINVLIARFWREGMNAEAFELLLGGTLDWMHVATLTWPLHLAYIALPPAWAYAAVEFAVVVLGYAGMVLLLRGAGVGARSTALMASLFAMTLAFSTLGLGLAAAPLAVHLALRGGGAAVWAAMFLIGWNSGLVMHGVFLPVVVLVAALMLDRPLRPASGPLAAYLAGSALGAAPLFAFVLAGRESHRAAWAEAPPDIGAGDALAALASNLLTQGSWYHATITPALYTAVFLIAGFAVARRAAWPVLATLLVAIGLGVLSPWLGRVAPGALGSIQFDRIGQFVAFLLILLGALVLRAAPEGRAARWVRGAAVLTLIQAMLVWSGFNLATLREALPPQERRAIVAEFRRAGLGAALRQADLSAAQIWHAVPTVPRFMRGQDYACLRRMIGGGSVVSAGPDPMLAPLHGIRALDGYHYLYPAGWHTAFRPVIADKLTASDDLRAYFDGWGSRVSLFIDRVPEVPPDYDALRALGATHVIADRELPLMPVLPDCALAEDLRLYRL